MITIICSTNREKSYSRKVSDIYAGVLDSRHAESRILDLKDLPADFIFTALFENREKNPAFNEVQKIVDSTDRFVFIVPEYNGSFPGILKAFLDGLRYPDSLTGKIVALVGLSSGTMGSALALSHLTDVMNYFGAFVLPIKPRLAGINKALDGAQFSNPLYQQLLELQADQLLNLRC